MKFEIIDNTNYFDWMCGPRLSHAMPANDNKIEYGLIAMAGYTTVSRAIGEKGPSSLRLPDVNTSPVQLNPGTVFSDGDGTGGFFGDFMTGIAFLLFMVAVFALMNVVGA
jgi:hypothetical protein